jgi:hypothetical protein
MISDHLKEDSNKQMNKVSEEVCSSHGQESQQHGWKIQQGKQSSERKVSQKCLKGKTQ